MSNKDLVREIYAKLKDSPFVRNKMFEKGGIIANFIINRNNIYFILNGSAALIKNTKYGDEELLEIYERFDFFGDNFYHVSTNNEMSVIARNKCEVFFFDFNMIYKDLNYFDVLMNIYELLNLKVKEMNAHTQLLSEKTTRNKLLTYFNTLSKNSGSRNIELDMSYKELASYLCVDRSAMMREINTLENDRMITRNKKRINLIY